MATSVRTTTPGRARRPRVGLVAQDPDVLDTWFSSRTLAVLHPRLARGDPRPRRFYPTDVLLTGYDILFFWVARMIMVGLYASRTAPFQHGARCTVWCGVHGAR